jgi:AcrR family transcriptional regulator
VNARAAPPERSLPSTTRERILRAASELFATRGYHATTTREIAAAVGVRQPSLFHHFPSKEAILQTLLSSDLDVAVPNAEALAAGDGPASVRLYRYLWHDISHLTSSPYNLSGLYTEEVMRDPAFEPWIRKRARLHAAIERILADGVASGEFVDFPVEVVREAITGILVRTLTLHSGREPEGVPAFCEQIVSLVMRAVLADPARLPEIRRHAVEGGG